MTRLAVMSDLHIDLNHFETYEIDTLIKCLKIKRLAISISLVIFLTIILSTQNLSTKTVQGGQGYL